MDMITLLPWWSYLLTAMGGVGFGFFQIWLLQTAIRGDGTRKWLIAVKFLLWAAGLLVFALIAIPLLLVFTICATAFMLCGLARLRGKARKEEM